MRPKVLRLGRFLILVVSVAQALGQQSVVPPVQSARNSACSNVIALHGDVTIKCSGLTEEQSRDLHVILNTILKERLDTKTVLEQLKQVRSGVTAIEGTLAAKRRQEEENQIVRQTPPRMEASLVRGSDHKFRYYIQALNLVPFEYRVLVVTKNDIVVSPVPMSLTPTFPKADSTLFYGEEDIQTERIQDGYLELRFVYQSLSYPELRRDDLQGKITKRYNLDVTGALVEIPQEPPR